MEIMAEDWVHFQIAMHLQLDVLRLVEANIPPVGDQDYTSPASSDSDATSSDGNDNQDDSPSQPNEHVVADDTQEPNRAVADSNNFDTATVITCW